jgi:hypothetical protein
MKSVEFCKTPARITVYGSAKDIDLAIAQLKDLAIPIIGNEVSDRLNIQAMLDYKKLKAIILYNGNTVWPMRTILDAFQRCVKAGGPAGYFTNALYAFMHLNCGTIAHFNKAGWIDKYPTNHHLRQLFARNEYGQPVLGHIPAWKADAVVIARAMHNTLNGK